MERRYGAAGGKPIIVVGKNDDDDDDDEYYYIGTSTYELDRGFGYKRLCLLTFVCEKFINSSLQ